MNITITLPVAEYERHAETHDEDIQASIDALNTAIAACCRIVLPFKTLVITMEAGEDGEERVGAGLERNEEVMHEVGSEENVRALLNCVADLASIIYSSGYWHRKNPSDPAERRMRKAGLN